MNGGIVRADIREPDGALRRVTLDDAGIGSAIGRVSRPVERPFHPFRELSEFHLSMRAFV
jgi:hypothetical protein